MKVAIRTDASLEIGTGHVMRCITLANELKQKGADIFFICRAFPGHLAVLIESHSYKVYLLPAPNTLKNNNSRENAKTSYQNWLGVSWQQDAEETHQVLLQQGNVSWLIVDHYAIDEHWEKQQKNVVSKIMVIDDLANRIHDCNILLDQNYYKDMQNRYTGKVSDNCEKLHGPKYALLRQEFREARQSLRKRSGHIKNIFIFFGGVDITNQTELAIKALTMLQLSDVVIEVVVGKTSPNLNDIEILCNKYSYINLHVQIENMAQIMAAADLCIGSGGTITWERCCMGLPTIAWPVADNQRQLLIDNAKNGLLYMPDTMKPTVEEISFHIKAVLNNSLLCFHMSTQCLQIIDGRGSVRVANRIIRPKIQLRDANIDDMNKIFTWRNDLSVRQYSNNNQLLDINEHNAWFKAILNNPHQKILIGVFQNDEIGVLRYVFNENEVKVSIYLVPGNSGRGLGAALLSAGETWLSLTYPDTNKVIAEVLPENKASMKLFEAYGYRQDKVQFKKRLN